MIWRRNSAQSTVELVTGIIIFVPIVLLFIDLALVAMASTTGDSVCREAARAAAKAPPATYTQIGGASGSLTYSGDLSTNRAQAVIDAANKGGGSVQQYALDNISFDQPALTFNNVGLGNVPQQGGVWPGTVTVNTSCTVHPLSVLNIINGGQGIKLTSSQNFPFTYVVPQNGSPN
jgi:hypothetical protein